MTVEAGGEGPGPSVAVRSPEVESRLHRVHLLNRPIWSVFVVIVGLSGSVLSVRGWGPVDIYGPVRSDALARLVLGGLVFAVVGQVMLNARWQVPTMLRWCWNLVFVAGLTLLMWSSAGRAYGLVAGLSLVLLQQILVSGPARRGVSATAGGPVLAAGVVVAAQVAWTSALLGWTLGLLVTSAVVLLTASEAPKWFEPLDRATGAVVSAGAMLRQLVGANAHEASAAARQSWSATISWLSGQRANLVLPTAAALGAALFTAPIFWRYASGPPDVVHVTDYDTHLRLAAQIDLFPLYLTTPHPIFHLSVRVVSLVLGQPLAATVVLAGSSAMLVGVLVWLCTIDFGGRAPVGKKVGVAFALGYFFVESPGMIAAAAQLGSRSSWVMLNHAFSSPTDTLQLPFIVLLVALCGLAIGATPERAPSGLLLAAVCIFSTLMKPSILVPLMIAIPVVLLLGRAESWRWRRCAWVMLPGAALLAWQTWFLEVGAAGVPRAEIAIRPFEAVQLLGLSRANFLILAPAGVVLLALWAAPRRYLADPMIRLSLVSTAVAVAVMLLLNETGARRTDGSFTKPATAAWIVLHVMSWRFLLGEAIAQSRGRRSPVWVWIAVAFLAIGVISGIIALAYSFGFVDLDLPGWTSAEPG